jgi:hypothetical protein
MPTQKSQSSATLWKNVKVYTWPLSLLLNSIHSNALQTLSVKMPLYLGQSRQLSAWIFLQKKKKKKKLGNNEHRGGLVNLRIKIYIFQHINIVLTILVVKKKSVTRPRAKDDLQVASHQNLTEPKKNWLRRIPFHGWPTFLPTATYVWRSAKNVSRFVGAPKILGSRTGFGWLLRGQLFAEQGACYSIYGNFRWPIFLRWMNWQCNWWKKSSNYLFRN